MVNAPRSKATLGNLKPASFAQNNRAGRQAHVGKAQMHMPMRSIIMAKHLHGAQNFHARCVSIHDKHRVAAVLWRVGVAAGHYDIKRTTGITRP